VAAPPSQSQQPEAQRPDRESDSNEPHCAHLPCRTYTWGDTRVCSVVHNERSGLEKPWERATNVRWRNVRAAVMSVQI